MMELSSYEACRLLSILESLVCSCDVKNGRGAKINDYGVWLTPDQCYVISSLVDKINAAIYDKEIKTPLSEFIVRGSTK